LSKLDWDLANTRPVPRQFFRLEEREPNPPPTTHSHEKDRLPVIWPLDGFAAVTDALGCRCAGAIDRLGRRRRGARRRRRLLSRASFRPPARLSLSTAGRRRRQDQAD